MYQADRINQPSPDRDCHCSYRRARHRRSSLRRRNRPGEWGATQPKCSNYLKRNEGVPCNCVWADGTDHEDSYHDQSCHMVNHRGTMAESPWEDLCSSVSICSQSSDEEMKPVDRSRVEMYPPGGDSRDYPATVLSLVPHSGPSAGLGPSVDLGGPPYPGLSPGMLDY